ncbi:L-type lectin-domain containing receptor kinase S.5 [Pyrus ussuriensis x Pyrus communis]|uniref:L-type lectin-domain containing receptor kinase S.5 n=1 Tax=Pyrus ussuriensis x Pyrus communis TaxID=2448454 RepID=A0A5N5FZL1_9ROSA|nr:L-type lectin-domain containing receptor kinase S.5 [Pyrus ussuriensis x Pyrus communis]
MLHQGKKFFFSFFFLLGYATAKQQSRWCNVSTGRNQELGLARAEGNGTLRCKAGRAVRINPLGLARVAVVAVVNRAIEDGASTIRAAEDEVSDEQTAECKVAAECGMAAGYGVAANEP